MQQMRDERGVDEEEEEMKRTKVEEGVKIMGELTKPLSWLGCSVLCVLMGTFQGSILGHRCCIAKFR